MNKRIKRRKKSAEIIDFQQAKMTKETEKLILKTAKENGFEPTLKLLVGGLLNGAAAGFPKDAIAGFGWSLGILVRAGYLTEKNAMDLCEEMNLIREDNPPHTGEKDKK